MPGLKVPHKHPGHMRTAGSQQATSDLAYFVGFSLREQVVSARVCKFPLNEECL
jgi:hypothetical protein